MSAEEGAKEQDKYLPIANIARLMKKALPANAKVAKDAKETVQECVSEFISFLTSEVIFRRFFPFGRGRRLSSESRKTDESAAGISFFVGFFVSQPLPATHSAATRRGKSGKRERCRRERQETVCDFRRRRRRPSLFRFLDLLLRPVFSPALRPRSCSSDTRPRRPETQPAFSS